MAITARASNRQILFAPGQPPLELEVSNAALEAIGRGVTATPSSNYSMEVIGREPIIIDVNDYYVEVIDITTYFPPGPEVQGQAIARQVLFTAPTDVGVSDATVEVIGYGSTPTDASAYVLEALAAIPYSVIDEAYTLEVIDFSTVQPPRPNQTAYWFTMV